MEAQSSRHGESPTTSDRHIISRVPLIRLRGWFYLCLMRAAKNGYFWPLVGIAAVVMILTVIVFWAQIVAFFKIVLTVVISVTIFVGIMVLLVMALLDGL